MNFDLDLILLVGFGFTGVYCLYTAWLLRTRTKLFDNLLLYPGGRRREDCRDPEGFMAFMRPRMAGFGALCTLMALYYLLGTAIELPKAAEIAQYVLGGGLFVWIMTVYLRAARRYW